MPFIHAVNDAINAGYRWARANRPLFWSGVYAVVFLVPVIWQFVVMLSIKAPVTPRLQYSAPYSPDDG